MQTKYRRNWRLQRLEARLAPASITITTVADNTAVDGKVSLREALTSANNNANLNADVVATGFYGTDTLVFDADVFDFPQSIKLLSALPSISGNVTFSGTSAANVIITRDVAAPTLRLFNCAITGVGLVTFSNLTLTGANAGTLNGAAIAAGGDNVTIINCVISNNTTTGSGGGIWIGAGGGNISVSNSTLSGNSAKRGGGIYFYNTGNLTLTGSTLSGNKASDSTGGGGIYHFSNTATIRNSTLSGNSATAGRGGGMTLQNSAAVAVQNSTIANNTASTTGGGIHRNSGTLSIESTVVAKNTATTSGNDIQGTLTADFSLIGISDDGPVISGSDNKSGTKASPLNPLLGTLASNGGPTQTLALLAGSPALNVGSNPAGLTVDQRGIGFRRVFGTVDIGAFEFQNSFTVTNTNDAGSSSLRQMIINANANPGADTIAFDSTIFATVKTITLTTGDINISDTVTVTGPGAHLLTISGNNASGIFLANGTGLLDITLFRLTLTKGSSLNGGAVFSNGENLSVYECVIKENTANFEGGIYVSAPGKLFLSDCQVIDNVATTNIGGIAAIGGATILRSIISGNSAVGSTGGLYVQNGLLLEESSVVNNSAGTHGGGILLANTLASTFVIRNSTISGNTAATNGGGFILGPSAAFPFNSTLLVQNSTITDNTATSGSGGGIARVNGSGTITLTSTIVSGNTNATAPDISSSGTVNVNFSAVGDNKGFVLSGTSGSNLGFQPHANLMLGTLKANGGTTLTHHPSAGSPLIGNGSNPAGLTTDQRGVGFVRANGSTDIGAVEVQQGKFVVTNSDDAGSGSLRQVIINSNGNPGTDVVTFDPAFFATSRTITLKTGELDITDSVTITGPGANLATVSGGNASRIFYIQNFSSLLDVTISGVTLTKAKSTGSGGAISSRGENLTVQNCLITANLSSFVGGIVVLAPGFLVIADSSVTNNTATTNNIGGVYAGGGAIIRRTTISGNKALLGLSGGLLVRGSLTLEDSTISNNSAGTEGGGLVLIDSASSTSFIRNSTISGNTATVSGGGISMGTDLTSFNGNLIVLNSTITNNTAIDGQGGGIAHLVGSGTITLESTIVSGNSNGEAPDIYSAESVTLTSSLVGNGLGFFKTDLGGNLPFGTNVKLGPLGNYGGSTLTHALLPGSPAINKGSNPAALTTDQRGFARIVGGTADIGAFEFFHTLVTGITRVAPAIANAASVQWTVTLDHAITGLSSGNFNLTGSGASGASITSVVGGGSLWTVTATTGIDGPLGLSLVNSTGTTDPASNPIGFLPFVGESYTIDRTAPQILSIVRVGPASTNAGTVFWTVTFSEPINNLSSGNFTLVNTGLGGTLTLSPISGSSPIQVLAATTGTGSGSLGLNLNSPGTVADFAGNKLTGTPLIGEVFSIDRTVPTVVLTTNAPTINDFKTGVGSVTVSASFSEPMDQLIAPTFTFPTINPSPSISIAAGAWTSATTFVGAFNVLDLNAFVADIDVRVTGGKDLAGNVHGQTTASKLLDLDTQNPIVISMSRNDPASTNLNIVGWTVNFTEAVTGVTSANLTLFNGGLGGTVSITEVSGFGTAWTVKASTGTGQGTLALYVVNTVGVTDSAGNPLAALPVIGPAYAIDHLAPQAAQIFTNTLTIADSNVATGFQVTIVFNEIMNQSINPSVSFANPIPGATLQTPTGKWLDAKTYQASYAVTDLGVEVSDVDVSITGAKDAVGNPQTPINITDLFDIDTKNPTVSKVQVNDGTMQRSRVTSLTVTFSEIVELPSAVETAFSLSGPNGLVMLTADLNASTTTQTIAKLTFSGPATEFASLKDGKYTLAVLANQVLDGVGNGMVSNHSSAFHRLFGDGDGNATVNASDFALFRSVFGLTGPSIFDFNNDILTNAADFAQFRARFGLSLAP